MLPRTPVQWIRLGVLALVVTAGLAGAKPTVPECEDLFRNLLLCQ